MSPTLALFTRSARPFVLRVAHSSGQKGISILALLTLAALTQTHAQSSETVIARLRERVKTELSFEQIAALMPGDVGVLLTEAEKRVLGSEYLTSEVNVPVTVSVFRDLRYKRITNPSGS